MIRLVSVIVLICSSFAGMAQKERFVTFELAGTGGVGSFNFEKCFREPPALPHTDVSGGPTDPFRLYWRAGLSFAPIDKNNGVAIVLPFLVHATVGNGNHRLDIGIGQTLSVTTKGQAFILMPASLGYRYQPAEKKYYLRFAYTPIVSYLVDFQWQNWGGITFGYRLKSK
jgi:hypothetical protein